MIVGKVKRLIAVSTALLAFGSVGAAAAEAGSESRGEPVRSGSILGGFFVAAGNRGPDCNETPDCLVWLQSDCDPALSLASDSALYTSIVDVTDLAGSPKKRSFRMVLNNDVGVAWGGITVQFWDAACNEIDPRTLRARRTGEVGRTLKFRIPEGTTWMTLTAWDTARLDWTLN